MDTTLGSSHTCKTWWPHSKHACFLVLNLKEGPYDPLELSVPKQFKTFTLKPSLGRKNTDRKED